MDSTSQEFSKMLIGARQTWLDVIEDDRYKSIVDEIEELETSLLHEEVGTWGRPMREKHFLVASECNYLNHGSYGATLKIVSQLRRYFQDKCDRNPNKFMDTHVASLLHRTRVHLAAFVGCAPEDLVLISNATTACATVLRALPFAKDESILICSFAYGAVKKAVHQITQEKHLRVVYTDIHDCLDSEDEICKRVEQQLEKNPHVKLALFDHIISETAVTLPVAHLISLCHRRGVLVAIDGAHAVGNITLDLRELKADFYWSNCHKWLCSSLGSAFLYIAKEHNNIGPLVVSHGYPHGRFQEFAWHGTDDYSQLFGIPLCIKFFNKIGFDKVVKHNHALAIEAAQLCASRWQTGLLCSSRVFNCMAAVRLPRLQVASPSGALAGAIRSLLRSAYDIELPILFINGEIYARLSAHVYYQLSDYEVAINAVLKLDSQHRDQLKALMAQQM